MDPKSCTACGREIPDFARVCDHCGHQVVETAALLPFELPTREVERPVRTPLGSFEFSPEDALASPAPEVESSDAEEAPAPSRSREYAMIAAAGLVGGAFTVALLMARGPSSKAVAAAVAPVYAAPAAAGKPSAAPHSVGWTTGNKAIWAGHERNSTAFELAADNMVSIWMRTVRPTLVVRCVAGSLDAFVYTTSAVQIEPQTNDHTVRFSFDGNPDVTERWPDSEEHDALFAPNGAAFAHRVAAARELRFGFKPHNAPPVTAHFTVAGLSALIEPAARECGWRK
jgi:hypothetical protein